MWGFESSIPSHMAHSSSGPGHRPLKAENAGSNPACATKWSLIKLHNVWFVSHAGSNRPPLWAFAFVVSHELTPSRVLYVRARIIASLSWGLSLAVVTWRALAADARRNNGI